MRLMLTSLIALTAAAPAALSQEAGNSVFNRIASFATAMNIAEGEDRAAENSAEIMVATEDGDRLIYSDSPLESLGMIDISDPAAPMPLGHIAMDGEPTTAVVVGSTAFVGVNTSDSFTDPSGVLRSVDLDSKTITDSCEIGGQPDSVAVNKDGTQIAIAIVSSVYSMYSSMDSRPVSSGKKPPLRSCSARLADRITRLSHSSSVSADRSCSYRVSTR